MPISETTPPPSVLVLEDEADLRCTMSQGLAREGYCVISAASGEEALEWLEHGDVDVAVLDIGLPGVSGIEVLHFLRTRCPETEILMATHSITTATALECLRAGASDVLTKPLGNRELLAAVGRAAERRRLRLLTDLTEVNRAIFEGAPERLPRRIVEIARQVMEADDASLMLVDGEGRLYMAWSSGLPPELQAKVRLPIGARVAGRVAEDRHPALIVDSLANDPRFADVPNHDRVRSSIIYPLRFGDHLLGVLNLGRLRLGRPFGSADLEQAALLAAQVALALENARLAERLRAAERLSALGRIAEGVAHETTTPSTALVVGLTALERHIDRLSGHLPVEDMETLRTLTGNVREAADRIRDVVYGIQLARHAGTDARLLFDVNEPLRLAARLARSAGTSTGATVQLRLWATGRVLGNPGQLCQVFFDLMVRAFEAGGGGQRPGRVVDVESLDELAGVVVRVTDARHAIAPGEVRRVFEPLVGVLPGLTSSGEIVTAHGGRIELSSSVDAGTTVTVHLPATGIRRDTRRD